MATYHGNMTAYDPCGRCWWPCPCHQPLSVGWRDACRFCVPLLPLDRWSLIGLSMQGSSTKSNANIIVFDSRNLITINIVFCF